MFLLPSPNATAGLAPPVEFYCATVNTPMEGWRFKLGVGLLADVTPQRHPWGRLDPVGRPSRTLNNDVNLKLRHSHSIDDTASMQRLKFFVRIKILLEIYIFDLKNFEFSPLSFCHFQLI